MGKDGSLYGYTLNQVEFDCRRGLERKHETIDYSSEGAVIYRPDEEELKRLKGYKWETPAPDSPEETIMRKVCLAPDREQ